jgi:uncharacterized protein YggE
MILSLRVEETKTTTEESQKTVDEKIAKVKEILKKYNINTSDIKTTNVNTYEFFKCSKSQQKNLMELTKKYFIKKNNNNNTNDLNNNNINN